MEHIPNPRVCVIGAGVSGLSLAKYLQDEGIEFTVFEATRYVGGTWRYDDRTGTDENGLALHTSMYKDLRTNLPMPVMQLGKFAIPKDMPSFPTATQFYEYIKSYAKHHDLEKHIQFLQLVISVKRTQNSWEVIHKHVQTGEEFKDYWDYVLIAIGHYHKPKWPEISGSKKFKGTFMHSHDYRVSDPFKNRRVLIVGFGPSGVDIAIDIAKVCRTLVHSHHFPIRLKTPFPPNYIMKPDIKEFSESGAVFLDGSFEEIDDVVYCTGYEYHYPFLDKTCEITVTPDCVIPLYKSMVNINNPTMLFIGNIQRSCNIICFDAQARYAVALIKGKFTLPSKEHMLRKWQNIVNAVNAKGRPIYDIHLLGDIEDKYYEALSKESGIERVPPVITNIRFFDLDRKMENLYTYRDYVYTVIDNEKFSRHYDPIHSGSIENKEL